MGISNISTNYDCERKISTPRFTSANMYFFMFSLTGFTETEKTQVISIRGFLKANIPHPKLSQETKT